jgi:hypothetical protein
MKKRIFELLTNIREKAERRLRLLCTKSSPRKRFITVLVTGCALSLFFIYTLVKSIYNIGTQDAQRDFMELQHIRLPELQKDATDVNYEPELEFTNLKNEEYEY